MSCIEYTVKVYDDGTKYWYLNGLLHREDGPACEYADRSKSWYLNGKLHRIDGPAFESADGDKYWYLNGVEYTEEEFKKELDKRSNICNCDGKVIEFEGQKYKLVKQ